MNPAVQVSLIVLAGAGLAVVLALATGVIRYIPNSRVGIVEKLFAVKGSVRTGFLARNGEAGFAPQVLRGGWHVFPPFQYRIHQVPLVTVPQGRIGYVFARDGKPLAPGQTLAGNATADDFQDAAAFLDRGGQRGPQRRVLREGTYALNLAQFVVITENAVHGLSLERQEAELLKKMAQQVAERKGFEAIVIKGSEDVCGVVTVHDGASLPAGELIAPMVGYDPARPEAGHDSFQDADRFLRAGGARGRQLEVLLEGTYYINRLFATVETIPKTVIEVGQVGVVVSYTGDAGRDLSGIEYRHGELVSEGRRGVWSVPLLPGKYAFNTYAGRVIPVPTTNFILKWIGTESGGHGYDENLKEVSLITRDAFEPSLPLSVVLHIDYRKASLVIQRFGDIRRLVEQTLDPLVSAYLKNVAQTRTLIELLQDRSAIQKAATEEMREKFAHYNLELEEVLIGTPRSNGGDQTETILKQLRLRQIAAEQVETYARQQAAAHKERELREAEARAREQQRITESELTITVLSNRGKADYQQALQQAAQIEAMAEAEGRKVRILAEADALRVRALGEAEADCAARVGVAEAVAIDEQVRAYGGPRYRVTQEVMGRFAEAVEKAGVDVVPRVVVGGGSGDGKVGGGAFEALLTVLLAERAGEEPAGRADSRPEVGMLREEVRRKVFAELNGRGAAGAPPPERGLDLPTLAS